MAQAKKRAVDDAGAKIGGARKDYRREAMQVADTETMTIAEQAELVKKDNIWAPPDYAALVVAGMDPQAAALVKIIRDRMSAKPTVTPGKAPAQAVRDYVEMVSMVRDACLSCRTVAQVTSVHDTVWDRIGRSALHIDTRTRHPLDGQVFAATRSKMSSILRGRKFSLRVCYDDMERAARMVAEGFAAEVPSWRKGVRAVECGIDAGNGHWILMKGNIHLRGSFTSENEAWAWLRSSVESERLVKAYAPPEAKEPDRPHLDILERIGPDVRQGREVTPEDFIREFGFRAVEFGNWLPDGERQVVLNMAYEAFHDLAAVLDVPPGAISLDGTLAVAFGARGTGKFAAHYEPGRQVINLTKLRGAGSSLHEFCHALDHYLGILGGASPIENGDTTCASGNRTHTKSRAQALPNLSAEVVSAIDALMDAFRTSPKTREQAVVDQLKYCADVREKLEKSKGWRARHLAAVEAGTQKKQKKRLSQNAKFIARWEGALPVFEARVDKLRAGDPGEPLGTTESAFLAQAKKLSGASGNYWKRPTELWARAGECAVFDMLLEQGRRSDYLVHGVEEDRCASLDYKGNPYPTGDERRRYKVLFQALFDTVRPVLTVEDEVDVTPHDNPGVRR